MPLTRAELKKIAKDCGIEMPKEMEDSIVQAHIAARDAYAEAESTKAVEKWKEENPPEKPQEIDVKKSQEYLGLKQEFDNYKQGIETEKENASKIDLVRAALKENGANEKFIDRMLKGADLSDIKIVEGKLESAETVVESFKGEWADVFGEVQPQPQQLGNPPAPKDKETDAFLEGFGD